MWLVVKLIDLNNKPNETEYDIMVNTDNISQIKPRKEGTCMLVYDNQEKNIVVNHKMDYFLGYLNDGEWPAPILANKGSKDPDFGAKMAAARAAKKASQQSGTTSSAIQQG